MVKLQKTPFAKYLANPAVSRSDLWTLHTRTPYYYKWRKDHGDHSSSSALTFGSAIHEAVLEPDVFEGRWAKYHGTRNQRFKEYQAFLDESGVPHERVLTASEWELLEETRKRVRELPGPSTLLEQGKAEQSVIYTDEATGLKCKARYDFIDMERGIAVDLKTAADISPDGLAKSFAQHGYALQAVHYAEGMRALQGMPELGVGGFESESLPQFFFLCVSKEMPIEVALFTLDRADLVKAAKIRRTALDLLKKCMDADVWPGIPHKIQTLSLPNWWAPNVA